MYPDFVNELFINWKTLSEKYFLNSFKLRKINLTLSVISNLPVAPPLPAILIRDKTDRWTLAGYGLSIG